MSRDWRSGWRLRPDMTVLDVGCGVGGPMRNIARIAGCSIVGINNNAYQLGRAERLNADASLADRCRVVPGDFMAMPFPADTFDAAYAIEATVHAPDWTGVFGEVFRCLKPGGMFALYDWCLTDRYEEGNAGHDDIKRRIVEGNGLVDIGTSTQLRAAIRRAGFDLIEHYDAAHEGGAPWYEPLAPDRLSLGGLSQFGTRPQGHQQCVAAAGTASRRPAGGCRCRDPARPGRDRARCRRPRRHLHADVFYPCAQAGLDRIPVGSEHVGCAKSPRETQAAGTA